MFKNFLPILFFIISLPVLHGQDAPMARRELNMSIIDTGFMKISYAFNATNVRDYKTYDDWQILEVGTRFSKYYSFYVFNSDSLVSNFVKKNTKAQGVPWSLGPQGKDAYKWSEYYFSEFFKDFFNNTLIEYSRMPHGLQNANSFYVEELPTFNWEIFPDSLTIVNYLCQKATCRFRGRDYIAWFTSEIPISNGPWKFGGLPGLILKVSDTGKRCDFECIGIEQNQKGFLIKKYNEFDTKYAKKERNVILKLHKEIHEDYYKVAKIIPVWGGTYPPKKKYEPIELE